MKASRIHSRQAPKQPEPTTPKPATSPPPPPPQPPHVVQAPEPPVPVKVMPPKREPEPQPSPVKQKPRPSIHITMRQVQILITAIVLLIIVITGAISYKQLSAYVAHLFTNHPINQATPTATASPSASPEPTLSAEQTTLAQKMLAQAPNTLVYYAYRTVYNTQHVFESDPSGQYQLERTTGFSDVYKFLGAPNGHYVLRWTRNSIEIAQADKIESFSQLVKVEDASQTINSVVWANDSSAFAFSTTAVQTNTLNGSGTIYHNRVYNVTVAGQHPSVIKDISATAQYLLRGYNPSQQQIVWLEQGATTAPQGLTLVNASNGQTMRTYAEFNDPILHNNFVLSSDLTTAYFVRSNLVIAEKLADQTNNPFYTITTACPGGTASSGAPIALRLAPDDKSILISTTFDQCPKPTGYQPSPTPTPAPLNTTYRVDISTGKVISQTNNSDLASLSPAWWSNDGKYIWVDSQQGSMIDASNLSEITFFPPNTPKQRVYFMAWLSK
jgi:hypothetical protein